MYASPQYIKGYEHIEYVLLIGFPL
jgi:hypothetical protein